VDLLGAGQPAINERHTITKSHIHRLAKRTQHHAAGQHGANRVAIRACMCGDQQPL
jgi:hypothetical protein